MKIVREVERNLTAALSESYDMEAMGAKGLIYYCERDEGTLFEVLGTAFSGAQSQRLLRYVPTGGGGIEETILCGFPTPVQTLNVTWTGAGIRNARLTFVDEPIRPFGRVPIRRWTGNLAAAGTVVLVTTEFLGLFQELQFVTLGDQEHHYNLGYQNMTLSQTLASYISETGTAGGTKVSARIPCPRQYSLTLVNDDAANALIYSGVLFGFY